MNNYWVTPIRLQAADFPGQISLFTNLKTDVFFRNVTLDFIARGGWADLPNEHFAAFIKALEEGYIRGERGWYPDFHQFTRRWDVPNWLPQEIATPTPRLDAYVDRCKFLISKKVMRPFTNHPKNIPPSLISGIIFDVESGALGAAIEIYDMVVSNLESHPNPDLAHRTFNLLLQKNKITDRYYPLNNLNVLSKINPGDRKAFMSWLFKSKEDLVKIKDAHYDASSIILDAVESGEVWYTGATEESRVEKSATEVLI